MGLMDKIRGEFIDIVEWLDDSRDTLVWRFPRYDNEIKMGARLVVRESQVAVFVNEGQLADVFTPGTYELETQNLPILSTLKGWKYGFHSPFKAEVYFVSTRLFTDMKWGTQNPVIVRDPEFGMVRLRAFGAYAAQVVDPRTLVTKVAGTDPQFRTEEIGEYLRQTIVGRLGSVLGSSGISVADLAASQVSLAVTLASALTEEFARARHPDPEVRHREHLAAAGGRGGRRQAQPDRDRRRPERVHPAADGQRDRGRRPQSGRRRRRGHRTRPRDGRRPADGGRVRPAGRTGKRGRRVRTAAVAVAGTVVHRRQRRAAGSLRSGGAHPARIRRHAHARRPWSGGPA